MWVQNIAIVIAGELVSPARLIFLFFRGCQAVPPGIGGASRQASKQRIPLRGAVSWQLGSSRPTPVSSILRLIGRA